MKYIIIPEIIENIDFLYVLSDEETPLYLK